MNLPKISSSMRQAHRSCERKTFFRYVAGIEVKSPPNAARMIGSAFHSGLELWRREHDIELAVKTAKTQLRNDLCVGGMGAKAELEAARLSAYLRGYAARFPDDISDEHKSEVEKHFETTDEIGFVDRMLIIKDRAFVIEDKTTSRFEQELPIALRMNDQLLTYAWFIGELTPYTFGGVIYRQTLKTQTKPKMSETIEQYERRLTEAYCEKNEFDEQEKYRNILVDFSGEEVLQFARHKEYQNHKIKGQLQNCSALEEYVPNSNECMGKFGPCDYLKICSNQGSMRFCADHYRNNTKEPLDGGSFKKELFGEGYPGQDISTGKTLSGRDGYDEPGEWWEE